MKLKLDVVWTINFRCKSLLIYFLMEMWIHSLELKALSIPRTEKVSRHAHQKLDMLG